MSAGLLLYRTGETGLEVLIVHPGGPYWAKKQAGAWSIPKGEFDPDHESGLAAARREFEEELGAPAPAGAATDLGTTRQKGGKLIAAWGYAGDFDVSELTSNTVSIEWPPRSGRQIDIPEVDEARWTTPAQAAELLNPAQVVFVERLVNERLDAD